MITRSKEGISLFYPGGESDHFPVKVREVKDVTGAGDTVLAMVAVVLANGLPLTAAALMSNLAASIAIQKMGCARVSLPQLAESLLADDTSNKVFDEEHTFALQQLLQSRSFSVISLSEREGFSVAVYQAIKELAIQRRDLLVYLRDPDPSDGYVSLLSSLKEVTYVIVKGHSLTSIGKVAKPEEAYLFEDGRLQLVDHLSSLL
jgi:D-beta-D-heptose 7-phosphate kinase/D-beta-D-heptose 1-phosphate adenosyltransferase